MSAPEPAVEQHQTLSGYLRHVQAAIRTALPDSSWVVAELTDFKRRSNGHVYFDVVEAVDGRQVAKASCTMFANVAKGVLAAWEQATGGLPQAGMNILVRVRAEFSPQYGFQLMATQIDPSYTLGDMQAKVQEIIAALKARGLFEIQRGLPAPAGYWRVAVISPNEAAGLADFTRDAERLESAGVCAFEYFAATFQGRDAAESIRGALLQVHGRHQQAPYDAVCIIRGGGAKADLAWLNDGKLAAWVCRFPVPVFTGIGHEVDECVLDLIAHRRFDTPSKVIGHIRAAQTTEASAVRANLERGAGLMQRLVAAQWPVLERTSSAYSRAVQSGLHAQAASLIQHEARFRTSRDRLLANERMALREASGAFLRHGLYLCSTQHQKMALAASQMALRADAMLVAEQKRLQLAATVFEKTNPLALLERGFALVRGPSGELITSAAQGRQAEALSLTFGDGQLEALVAIGESAQRSAVAGVLFGLETD